VKSSNNASARPRPRRPSLVISNPHTIGTIARLCSKLGIDGLAVVQAAVMILDAVYRTEPERLALVKSGSRRRRGRALSVAEILSGALSSRKPG
jgi:hypothetical protein